MNKIKTTTTDHKNTPRLSQKSPKTKHDSGQKDENRTSTKRESSKLMKLQEALQDPISVCEGT